jgi:hypothetical protein
LAGGAFSWEPKLEEEKHHFGVPFLIGLVLVAILIGALYLTMRNSPQQQPEVQRPLAFGPAEQAYVPQIKLANLGLSAYENMFHQKVTYLNGDLTNGGTRTIQAADVTVEFHDATGKVVLRETRRVIGDTIRPLQSGETESMQIGFEDIPPTWNGQFPTVRITGLQLQ